jgi:hypothetical protein
VRGHTARDRQTSFRLLDVPNVGMYRLLDVPNVGMYLRRTQRRRRDGTVVGYLQLAHNRRVDGVTQAKVLLNRGRGDELDVEGLRRLMGSIGRCLERSDGVGALEEASGGELRAMDARPIGAAWALDALWRRLAIDRAIGQALRARRHNHDVERVLFALVANRAIAPASKLGAAEWATHDAAIPGLAKLDDDRVYRAMDVLASADAEGKVQEAVFFSVADLLNLEVDLLFFDTTSTYFEVEHED